MAKNSQTRGKFAVIAFIVFLAAVIFAACHSGPPQIAIGEARAVLSPAIYGEAMVFMNIKNDGGADVLKGVNSDIPGATVSFHVMEGKRMAHVATVGIPGGKSTVFKMGSSHIMIEDMPRTMVAGSPFTLTLVFEKSGVRQLHLKLEKAPMMPMPMS
ncbi:MAG: copper chaperone PCu(A)C [Nitrospiraceae bacterium]|nr:copper chaperone PCu(A)C [Nitrospiraceae bacterium]